MQSTGSHALAVVGTIQKLKRNDLLLPVLGGEGSRRGRGEGRSPSHVDQRPAAFCPSRRSSWKSCPSSGRDRIGPQNRDATCTSCPSSRSASIPIADSFS